MEKYTHLGVYGVLIQHDHILLIQKARGPHKGKWDLPGGSVEFGEEPEHTLQREFVEETGLASIKGNIRTAISYTLVYQYNEHKMEELHHIGIIYDVEGIGERQSIREEGDGHDSMGAKWIKLEELMSLPLTPFVEMMMEPVMNSEVKQEE
ncbi:NUDIX hydrolase [Paenibacillus sp. JCM 10914]|uniref:NUDIX hydrolase n=1 Tax=Paenibacillus sp. JCM 10914 TaxID=1236974 RepID=UPI00055F4E40|nr:NUDIX domain-containing protein [Paenibacillus sp. JCM 10914]